MWGKQRKLQEERKRQEDLIAGQLRAMELDHELEYEKLTQRGLIANQQQKIAKEKQDEEVKKKRIARKNSRQSSNDADDEDSSQDDSNKDKAPTSKEEMSYVEMARMGFCYQQLVNAIIRPPRAKYEVSFPPFLSL